MNTMENNNCETFLLKPSGTSMYESSDFNIVKKIRDCLLFRLDENHNVESIVPNGIIKLWDDKVRLKYTTCSEGAPFNPEQLNDFYDKMVILVRFLPNGYGLWFVDTTTEPITVLSYMSPNCTSVNFEKFINTIRKFLYLPDKKDVSKLFFVMRNNEWEPEQED